jgi:hypothetical protein
LVLNISNNDLRLSGCKVLAEAISESQIASLDVSNSRLTWNDNGGGFSTEGIIDLANAIKDMRALSFLNMADNNLGELVPPEGWSIKNRGYSYQMYVHIDGREQKEDPGSIPEGIVALANAFPDMGALTKLILKDNAMLTKSAGKALASALAGNSVLTELDISGQSGYMHDDGPGFAKELAAGISDIGALITLDISSNRIGAEQKGGIQRICVASGIDLAM